MDALSQEVLQNQSSDLLYGIREGDSPLAAWPIQPCRIVFLDFDGVLNSDLSNVVMGTRHKFATESISVLNNILVQSESYIVITSSWREHWTLRENARFLEEGGVLRSRVIGKTPSLGIERGKEIDQWLRGVPFRVASFVILDDQRDMGGHSDRHVWINGNTGLDESHVGKAVEVLRLQWFGFH